MDEIARFEAERDQNILKLASRPYADLGRDFVLKTAEAKYTYNFQWMGRPIIQLPQDMVAMQEIVWQVRPDLIIETGIAHGGSLTMNASLLALLEYCEAAEAKRSLDPGKPSRRVVGIDIDIRSHNRAAIEAHPLANRITMIEGSSVAPDVVAAVADLASQYKKVLVLLDSNHTHDHVLAELEAYAPLTSEGSYCCVFDTLVEDMPDDMFQDRPWGKGDNPKTAVWEYLRRIREEGRAAADGTPLRFEMDKGLEAKLVITVAPDGYLKRV